MSTGLWGDPRIMWGDPAWSWDGHLLIPPVGLPDARQTGYDLTYEYELLDRDGALIRPMGEAVEGSGSHAWSSQAGTHRTMSVDVHTTGDLPDWYRVRPIITLNGETWPLGVYEPAVPEVTYSDTSDGARILLVDRTAILAGDYFVSTSGVSKGENVVDAITTIIASTGEDPGAITPHPATLLSGVEWDPDTSKRGAVNLLCAAAGFFSINTDMWGRFVVKPNTPPSTRPEVTRFLDGDNATAPYDPVFTRRHEVDKIPNVYIAVSAAGEGEDPLVSEWTNTNLDDPYSITRRGYRKLPEGGKDLDVVTTGQSALDDYARRRGEELSSVQETITILAPPSRIDINDRVRFTSRRWGLDGPYVVQRIEATHTAEAPAFLWQYTLRRVHT